ncbi:MAG: leucyl aminopeptidase [Deltaproteobacteria bacterium]|nr:leucyl aminopeptidase [Deltaproteobacteria bacterium]MBW2072529.1 leucyl aminopeptidase [Deltaproteobacteria bacterium]
MEIAIREEQMGETAADALILFHFADSEVLLESTARADELSSGLVKRILESGDFKGEHLECVCSFVHGRLKIDRLILVGLGKREEFTVQRLKEAVAVALKYSRERRLSTVAVPVIEQADFPAPVTDVAEACVLGGLLGSYQFTELRTAKKEEVRELKSLVLLAERRNRDLQAVVQRAEALAAGVYLTRNLVTLPANMATPRILANWAREVAEQGRMSFRVIEMEEARQLGMGAFLAVAQGSEEPGLMVEMDYQPSGAAEPPVVLVGKGITFDSGGISIKPAKRMEMMKHDMAGAGAVIGVMKIVADLQLPLRVVALIPCTENLPSGKAYKPGDVIRSLSGQTIEVISTDAEGRLVLADAICYAERFRPQAIVDIATLTGACIVALGNGVTGIMGNNDNLIARVQEAAEKSGEKVWQLPLWDSYFDLLKSDITDMKNVGGREAGAITGGIFLKQFVPEKVPWVHLDIAGSAWEEKDKPLVPKGATGVPVQMLAKLLCDWQPLGQ